MMRKQTLQRALHNLAEQLNPNILIHPIPDSSTCISLIKQCKTIESLKSLHASMIRSHLHLNLFFSTNLITQYSSLGSISHSYSIFSSTQTSDVFLWNVMIRCFVESSCYDRAVRLYCRMKEYGVRPDNYTFPFVVKACGHLQDVKLCRVVHGDVIEFGYEYDVFVDNSLITVYGKCEQVELSRQVFDRMSDRSLVSWSAMIGAYAQNGFYKEGFSVFRMMLSERIKPNRVAVLNVIPCVSSETDADEISGVIVDSRLDLEQSIQNAAMVMYSKCGRIDIARRIFEKIPDKDLVTWSSMIEAYAQADKPIEALDLFKQLKLQKVQYDYVTILSVIRACSSLGSLRQAQFIHGVITRCSFQNELILETALIDLYVKCGSLEYARKVFERMRKRNLISWSTIISGYGMHGRGREALLLFDQMKETEKPDHITFVSVLSACGHAGLIAEGWSCFHSMTKDFGLTPTSEHYACMVDLLGRAGQLNEAREFINNMLIKPESGVWGALLGACRIHSNVELAEFAAKSLFELDPENPGRYVLLSNIYKSMGKREEADRIRAVMKRKGVKKAAGHTIIDVKNKMYKFVVGDKSNPQTELIHKELEILMERIRREGYVPDTNFVLHDVEEEMKEKMLYLHSEKLAIVYGILNSSPGTVIRIKKNLRVCGDCHTATKFISKVTGREIVVRDSHRFHHFKGGECSCGDYW
ncbi:putative pentatricopeptide repeat-containing protein At3g49142 [Papaver somniferum]|uniref:putative pentatricopeptide repeat-containing protein At3g49142 n=1 Tax=Papaver somniferum TaxID=3469 RepID=UPI000E6FE753|nr:putative pentatricopeptide repeat-containing protein At3g49142 [Papaver somniferum]